MLFCLELFQQSVVCVKLRAKLVELTADAVSQNHDQFTAILCRCTLVLERTGGILRRRKLCLQSFNRHLTLSQLGLQTLDLSRARGCRYPFEPIRP